jgi:hypothetical protein
VSVPSSTTRAFRCSPASFARSTGDFRNGALKPACSFASRSCASDFALLSSAMVDTDHEHEIPDN